MSTPNGTFDCGHDLAELSNYLDTGELQDPAHLDSCPECQAGLASLRRLSTLGKELLDADVADAGKGTDGWMQKILGNLALELRPGRSIPLRGDHPDDTLSQTEGAVSALIRSIADTLPGTTAGRCRLHGDVTTPGAEVTVEVHLAIVFGHPLEERASSLRRQLARELAVQTELNITSIDITITDVLEPQPAGPGTAAGLMGQTPPQEKP